MCVWEVRGQEVRIRELEVMKYTCRLIDHQKVIDFTLNTEWKKIQQNVNFDKIMPLFGEKTEER